jgi:hypothetical protein
MTPDSVCCPQCGSPVERKRRVWKCGMCGKTIPKYKGRIVHLVPKSGGRWTIAWPCAEGWETTVHRGPRGTLRIAPSLRELVCGAGAYTYATANGATKRARQLGY